MTNDVREVLRLVESGALTAGEARERLRRLHAVPASPAGPAAAGGGGIAIIGMSGRFAAGDTPEHIWVTLESGSSAVREVPRARWDPDRYYHPDPGQPGRTNSRWGGFLDDIDAFDPLFFQLSGAEAEVMDPQQRIFLEVCWSALEDAGYAGASVSGLRCGVYAGAPASDYPDDDQRSGMAADAQVMMGNDTAILAARISYLLNLRGPSLALNTACSSSLVAIQVAAQSIAAGQVEMALAGGVCLFVTPGFYISASKAGMLSPRGQCHTFDHRADGFVPGEGAGVVVLKDLAAARRDGDHIRGVLLGVGTNQDGRSNGITAPNSQAQSDLQLAVYRDAGIDPETIGLVEAHGTGTQLGDPIEIEALTRSFSAYTGRRQFCAVGSIKTNIGHTGQAAGVAGLIKCLLAFERQTIPPSLNFEEPNPHIDFAQTPFYVPASAVAWPSQPGRPRRAAVSSYGYSGTNAHLVVEEPPAQGERGPEERSPHLVLVSAKTRDALRRRVADLAEWLAPSPRRAHLVDVAFTLCAGRAHHQHRAAFVVDDTDELVAALRRFQPVRDAGARPLGRAERARLNDRLRQARDADRRGVLAEVATAYERGFAPDPGAMFPDGGRRTPLPTYPFARDRFWSRRQPPVPRAGIPMDPHRTDGDVRVLRFVPTGAEDYLTDHLVAGRRIVAAMVSTELVRSATEAIGAAATCLSGVRWHLPLRADAPGGLLVRLEPDGAELLFTVTAGDDPAVPAATGRVGIGAVPAPEPIELAAIRDRLDRRVQVAECYHRLAALGLTHGPRFQVLRDLHTNGSEVLARLELGSPPGPADLPWQPALLDGAIQAMVALGTAETAEPRVPYALDSMVVHAPLPPSCLAYLRADRDGTVEVTLLDPEGAVLATLRGLATAVPPDSEPPAPASSVSVGYYRPMWIEDPLPAPPSPDVATLVVGDGREAETEAVAARRPDLRIIRVGHGDYRDAGDDRFTLDTGSTGDYLRLLTTLGPGGRPTRVALLWPSPDPGVEEAPADPDPGLRRLRALCRALTHDRSGGPTEIRLVHPADGDAASPFAAAIGGFARTVLAEDPDLRIRAIGLPPRNGGVPPLAEHWDVLWAPDAGLSVDQRVGRDGLPRRRVLAGTQIGTGGPAIRDGGTYLITGGAGGIGLRLAGHLARRRTHLVLVGRSDAKPAIQDRLDALRGQAASVTYVRADVTDEPAMDRMLTQVRARFSGLTGIIHGAGVLADRYLAETSDEDAATVLGPKVAGALVIDRLTRDDPLDFFVVLSSVVATVGNPGQAMYAYANGVLDGFARWRSALRDVGRRSGATVALALPAWAGVGMAATLPEGGVRGRGLDDDEGCAAFDAALTAGEPHLVVLKGTRAELAAVTGDGPPNLTPGQRPQAVAAASPAGGLVAAPVGVGADGSATAERFLRTTLADELRLPIERIDVDDPLEAYGIDSVMVTRLAHRLEQDLGPVPKTIFFEYRTLRELAGFVVQRYPEALARLAEPAAEEVRSPVAEAPRPAAEVWSPAVEITMATARVAGEAAVTPGTGADARTDAIAVIGVAGRYPMADDLDEFWDNLVAGRDCVTEIPPGRWKLDEFYDPQRRPHRSYSKWGGFLSDIDRFDPVFFNIAPREADMMDPQERLFLQTVWHVLENAGYPRSALAGSDTGVFVGVMYGHYQLLPAAPDGRLPISSYASIANRVSYVFDLHGPSLALDTMCSSSLTAVHLACESIRRGECRTAVAGGVNLAVHPRKYLQLSLGRFASTDGRCRSFGAGGDGYVPGEGVGALLLKPLAAARADGDHVHAVIRGTAINHGGRTTGYSVPDVRAQRSVIGAALRAAGVSAGEVGYIEAHGTGTALGDPIEVAALGQAYADATGAGRHIPIGSVKSSIGHLESAAGVAALTKVILQLRHGTIAPSLHAEQLNPDLGLDDAPFVVATRQQAWPAGPSGRRIAGISSFGAGGANAHVIVEEPLAPLAPQGRADAPAPQVVVLSAAAEPLLRALAGRLAAHLRRHAAPDTETVDTVANTAGGLLGLRPGDLGPHDNLVEAGVDKVLRARLGEELAAAYGRAADGLPDGLDTATDIARYLSADDTGVGVSGGDTGELPGLPLADVAYTLQVGREHLGVRFACVVDDMAGAIAELAAFAAGGIGPRSGYGVAPPSPADDHAAEVETAAAGRDGQRLARLWIAGAAVDWRVWHAVARRRRVPLVGSPFRRDRHWLEPATESSPTPVAEATSAAGDTNAGPAAAAFGAPAPSDATASAPQPRRKPSVASDENVRSGLRGLLIELAAGAIGLPPDRLDPRVSLGDYGFDSMTLKDLAERIADRLGIPFTPAVFFERPGIDGITDWLVAEHGGRLHAVLAGPVDSGPRQTTAEPRLTAEPTPDRDSGDVADGGAEPIAIIGMSGRFPGSPDLDAFWRHLRERRDLVTEIPVDRWDWRALADESRPPDQRCPYRWGAFIDDVDTFDPRFFGISPAEAEMMDPQQRVLLQTTWAAIEDAGYRPSALSGEAVGVFAGLQFSDYQHLLHEAGLLNAQAALGNEHSIAVNRISYLLNLHGSSEPVNTACSSSLVAVHRAVRSLRTGESRLALAGGIALNLSSHSTVAAGMMGLLSPDGRCKTLDRRANGYVKGEGVGVLVLKPLREAVADGDHIHGVIRGTAINHGGRAASLTAPNSAAQAALLRTAVDEAGVDPRSIGLLELHGTGTELGDPVEINGIRSAFRELLAERQASWPADSACGIGSVKTNIGHLEPASGIAGLIKVLLAMRHRTIPGMVHLDEVNPYVDLTGSPFEIVRETTEWRQPVLDGRRVPRRAGVSSFGFGGVNAHVVVEEYAGPSATPVTTGDLVFPLSARTPEALTELIRATVGRLREWEDDPASLPAAADVAYTLQTGREALAERIVVVAADLLTLRRRLDEALDGGADGTFRSGTRGKPDAPEAAPTTPEASMATAAVLAGRWAAGHDVDWADLPERDTSPRRVPLPTYPFARQRYWFTAPETGRVVRPAVGGSQAAVGGSRAAAGEPFATAAATDTGGHPIQDRLRAILTAKLKLEPGELDEDRPLQDFGVDSMLSAMITQVVQDDLDIQVPLTALVEYPTLRSLSRYIETEFFADRPLPAGPGATPALAGSKPAGDRVRLPAELLPINTTGTRQPSFWVHGATGYSAWFQNLSQALGPEYPLYAFQARGTDGHSMPHSLDEMVEHYVACLRLVQPAGPYVIGGYSFGGLVAMEMARRLQAEGETIRHLVLFDTYPATQEVFDRHHGVYDEDFLQMYLVNYFLKLDEDPSRAIRSEDLAHLPASLRVAELARLAKDRGQKRISADDIYLYLHGGLVCSAHAEGIYQIYSMRPYDASDVLFFQATDGFTGRASALYWRPTRILDGYDYVTPWRDIVDGGFTLVQLDNDHLNMLEQPTLATAARHIEALLTEPPSLDTQRYEGFQRSFDAVTEFGRDLLVAGFAGTKALPAAGASVTREQLRTTLDVAPEYRRLFDASVDILVRRGLLEPSGEDLVGTEAVAQVWSADPESIADRARRLAEEHPDVADYLPLLTACQAEIFEVMRGRRAATDVLFPGGSMELVGELYKGNVQTEFYNRLAADRVSEYVGHFLRRYPRSAAQVFEVGAGTGGTSAFVLDALAGHGPRVRYRYTDIGAAFLQMARAQFADGRNVEFDTYDIERTPEEQGFEPWSMDVVLASNVLHTTRQIARTLAQCRRLLKPGGIIVINELTHRLDYNTLTFGLTSGWWLYDGDDPRITGSPLLSAADWRRSLGLAGFADTQLLGIPGAMEEAQAQCLIVAMTVASDSGRGAAPDARVG